MALQTSGAISLSDIANEIGEPTIDMSLRTLSTIAGFTRPDSLSEFYGYSNYTNSHYYKLVASSAQSLVRQGSPSPFDLSGTQDLSISAWFKQDQTSAANQILWDLQNVAGATSGSTANRFFLQYNASLNRFIVRHRTSGVNYDRQYALHDNNSVTGTGSSSSNKWTASNRGNVNADGWCLLTVTYDASQSVATNGLKLYWNGSELTNSAASSNGSRSTSAVNYICIGNNAHNYSTTGGAFYGGVDEFKIYLDVLTSGEVSTIYSSGVIVDAANSHSSGLLTEFTFDSNTADSNGEFGTSINDTGTRTLNT